MEHIHDEFKSLLNWFQFDGGSIDLSSMGLTTFPSSEGGRGAVAVQDIPVRLKIRIEKTFTVGA